MTTLRGGALAVRFALEMASLWVFFNWGYHVGTSLWSSIFLGLGTPLVVVLIWGGFIAPKSRVRWPQTAKELLGLLVFTLASLSLYSMNRSSLALGLLVVAVADTGLLLLMPASSPGFHTSISIQPKAPKHTEPKEEAAKGQGSFRGRGAEEARQVEKGQDGHRAP